jgi:quinol-cytochrome oxidoreductase complex cytochrome b subunit
MTPKNKIETGIGSDALKNPQRIVFLTKSTSAQVKGADAKKVMAYPHLLLREGIVFQVLVIAIVLVSLFWDAPLEQLANPLITPNPAKAPWYFLGLQELLHYFPPFVAGILIPTLVLIALVIIPYFNINIDGEPVWGAKQIKRLRIVLLVLILLLAFLAVFDAWTVFVPTLVVGAFLLYSYTFRQAESGWRSYIRSRPVSWWVMTWFVVVSIVLTAVGTFFRGPGWSWVWPWRPYGS